MTEDARIVTWLSQMKSRAQKIEAQQLAHWDKSSGRKSRKIGHVSPTWFEQQQPVPTNSKKMWLPRKSTTNWSSLGREIQRRPTA